MLESLLLVSALIIDSFIASASYGAKNIKIPILSALVIDFIGVLFLVVSLLLSSSLKLFISPEACKLLGFAMLMIIGISGLFQGMFKTYLRKKKKYSIQNLNFKIGSIKFVFDVYLEETLADLDRSQVLSAGEAVYLAMALSIDSLATGLGSGLFSINYIQIITFSTILGFLAVIIGSKIGHQFTKFTNTDISWLSGAILIILAIIRFL